MPADRRGHPGRRLCRAPGRWPCLGALLAAVPRATTSDVINNQLSALSSATTLVSITIGGNDVGFSNVMTTCVLGSTSTCVNAVNQAEAQARSQLPGLLGTLFGDISARAPNAQVVVMGYPEFHDLSGRQGASGSAPPTAPPSTAARTCSTR